MKTEIIMFDNHDFYFEALSCFLDKNGFNTKYVYRCTADYGIIKNMVTRKPAVAILNIVAIGLNAAFDLVDKLLSRNPQLKIIILSPNPEVTVIKKFFDKGVRSFLTRTTGGAEFFTAINEVMADKAYINEDTKKSLYEYICNLDERNEKKHAGSDELTVREKEVLDLICEGLRTKEIAGKLHISNHTVESHRRNIMLKLDVRNASMLVKFAVDNHLVN